MVFLLLQTGTARADTPTDPHDASAGVTISGDVDTVRAVTRDAVHTCPRRTEVVTFRTPAGPQTHSYLGCPLEALIAPSLPRTDEVAAHPLLTVAVVARGADGYEATLSWAELSPDLAARPALVAWRQDEVSLQRPRLVVPADLGGSRYVSDLTDLRVVQLASPR